MTKRQHPKDQSGSEKLKNRRVQMTVSRKRILKINLMSMKCINQAIIISTMIRPATTSIPIEQDFIQKLLILTFSPREKELAILIALPVNDHLLIYRDLCSFKSPLRAMDWPSPSKPECPHDFPLKLFMAGAAA